MTTFQNDKAPASAADGLDLWAISPLDGRYRSKLQGLGSIVGEGGLIGYRTFVEAQWLLHLAEVPQICPLLKLGASERKILEDFTPQSTSGFQRQVKDIEKTTNHDVKAVEYYLQHRLKAAGAPSETLAFIHFACTSEDINNLSYALMLKDLRAVRLLPAMDGIIADLADKAERYADVGMLSRTHGQTASPTTLGKELAVFGRRLQRQRDQLAALGLEAKINGAVGNYNAHMVAFPEVNWEGVAKTFIEKQLGLTFNPLTTQIENHDSFVEFGTILAHFNTILIGLCRDIWGYISLGYFRQTVSAKEVGSSTMPHKVNPIDFENAEGNLGLANAMARHFADKLPISRWQRDLSDSTVLRALGTLVGHSELAWTSLKVGLGKITAEPARLAQDLDAAWEVLAEPIQTVMRRHGIVDAYERLKAATRGQAVTREVLMALVDGCQELPAAAKASLKALTPGTYVGDAPRLAKRFAQEIRQTKG